MKRRLTLFLLLLLAVRLFGQQDQASDLPSLLAAAQQAQAADNYVAAAASYSQAVKLRPDLPELRANLGLMQHEAGNYAASIRSFQEALRLNPSLYVPRLFLGIDYVRTGKRREAIPLLLEAEKMHALDPLPSFTLGRNYSSLGEYAQAILEFRRTIQLDPKQSSAWFDLGIAELNTVEEDARVLSTRADSTYAKALYAESMVKQSRYKEAAESYQAILGANDQPPCMRSEAGFLSLKQGNLQNAGLQFNAERSEHPECSLAILGEARLRIVAGSHQDALPLIQQLFRNDSGFLAASAALLFDALPPERLESFLNYLVQQQSSGSVTQELYAMLTESIQGTTRAEKETTAAKNTAGSHPALPVVLKQARQEYMAGHHERCASLLKHSLHSGNVAALQVLAACSFFTGDYTLTSDAARALRSLPSHPQAEALYWSISANEKLASASLARFEQLEPDSPRSHILLGDVYRQRQRYDDAQKEYARALELSPDNVAALLGLASAYYGDSNLDKTVELAQKALLRSPDDPEINLLMGEALISQHKFTDAERFLLKSFNVKPQMLPHVHALLGEAYAANDNNQDAIRELKLGAESDGDGSIHYRLARLYSKLGDSANATVEIQRMKALQEKRRKAAVIAVEDAHSTSLDDAP